MEAKAIVKNVRHSDRKLRQVADMIRGKSVDQSFAILGILRNQRKGARIIEDLLKSAVANLQNNGNAQVSSDEVNIAQIFVDKSSIMKRIRPRSQGRAYRIHKNLSHVTIVVAA